MENQIFKLLKAGLNLERLNRHQSKIAVVLRSTSRSAGKTERPIPIFASPSARMSNLSAPASVRVRQKFARKISAVRRDLSVRVESAPAVSVPSITVRSAEWMGKPTEIVARPAALTSKSNARGSAPAVAQGINVRQIATARRDTFVRAIPVRLVPVPSTTSQFAARMGKLTEMPAKLAVLG